jgi:hypothetical protein
LVFEIFRIRFNIENIARRRRCLTRTLLVWTRNCVGVRQCWIQFRELIELAKYGRFIDPRTCRNSRLENKCFIGCLRCKIFTESAMPTQEFQR